MVSAIWDQDQDLSGENVTPNSVKRRSEKQHSTSRRINSSCSMSNSPISWHHFHFQLSALLQWLKQIKWLPYIQFHLSSGMGSLHHGLYVSSCPLSSLRLPFLPTTLYIDGIFGFMSSDVWSTSSLLPSSPPSLPSSLFYKKWEGISVCCFKLWTTNRRFTVLLWSADGRLRLFSISGSSFFFFPGKQEETAMR